jgi:hypothetical protein
MACLAFGLPFACCPFQHTIAHALNMIQGPYHALNIYGCNKPPPPELDNVLVVGRVSMIVPSAWNLPLDRTHSPTGFRLCRHLSIRLSPLHGPSVFEKLASPHMPLFFFFSKPKCHLQQHFDAILNSSGLLHALPPQYAWLLLPKCQAHTPAFIQQTLENGRLRP